MYISADDQQEFYSTCVSKGCKNFIFSEYSTYTTKHGDKCLHLGPHIVDFLVKSYRGGIAKPEQANAHIRLDVPPEIAGKLFEEFICKTCGKRSRRRITRVLFWLQCVLRS